LINERKEDAERVLSQEAMDVLGNSVFTLRELSHEKDLLDIRCVYGKGLPRSRLRESYLVMIMASVPRMQSARPRRALLLTIFGCMLLAKVGRGKV
jgi:hypothetical protein